MFTTRYFLTLLRLNVARRTAASALTNMHGRRVLDDAGLDLMCAPSSVGCGFFLPMISIVYSEGAAALTTKFQVFFVSL